MARERSTADNPIPEDEASLMRALDALEDSEAGPGLRWSIQLARTALRGVADMSPRDRVSACTAARKIVADARADVVADKVDRLVARQKSRDVADEVFNELRASATRPGH